MRFTRPLVLPARVGALRPRANKVWVGRRARRRRLPRRPYSDALRFKFRRQPTRCTDARHVSDFLLELGKNPKARKLIQTLGLPHSAARRSSSARGAVGGAAAAPIDASSSARRRAALAAVLAETLAVGGRRTRSSLGDGDERAVQGAPGEAFGRPPRAARADGDDERSARRAGVRRHRASTIRRAARALRLLPSARRELARVGSRRGARAAARARSSPAAARRRRRRSTASSAASAKEVGRKRRDREPRRRRGGRRGACRAVLRFLLSPRSAFVTGAARSASDARARGRRATRRCRRGRSKARSRS